MSLPSRLLGANPSIQVSTLLSGSLSTPSAKLAFVPPESFEYIATATPSGSTDSVTFSSIPSTYKHLMIRAIANANYTGPQEGALGVRFNGDTGSSYQRRGIRGIGTGAINVANIVGATFADTSNALLTTASSDNHSVTTILIPDYASTTFKKSALGYGGVKYSTTNGETTVGHGGYASTSAITSVTVFQQNGNLFAKSVMYLYGIKG